MKVKNIRTNKFRDALPLPFQVENFHSGGKVGDLTTYQNPKKTKNKLFILFEAGARGIILTAKIYCVFWYALSLFD